MNDFSFAVTPKNKLEVERDVSGGVRVLSSDVYDGVVKHAYLHKSASGAIAAVIAIDFNGFMHKETVYFTTSSANGNKTTYTKDDKEFGLPGFNRLVTMIELNDTDKDGAKALSESEEKVLEIYNFDAGKVVPTKLPVLTAFTELPVKLGMRQVRENKKKYVGEGDSRKLITLAEERVFNTIERVFSPKDSRTMSETVAGTDAKFINEWLKVNKDSVKDDYEEIVGASTSTTNDTSSTNGTSDGTLFGS